MQVFYDNGLCQEALILALSGSELRAAIQGVDDPALFSLVGDSWHAEDGRRVTFEFSLGVYRSQEFLTAIQEVSSEGLSMPRACESSGECLLKRMAGAADRVH